MVDIPPHMPAINNIAWRVDEPIPEGLVPLAERWAPLPEVVLAMPARPVDSRQLADQISADIGASVAVVAVADRLHVVGVGEGRRGDVERVVAVHQPTPRQTSADRLAALEARVAALESRTK